MSSLVNTNFSPDRQRAPREDELQLRFSDSAVFELAALKGHYPNDKACILPALWIAQREYAGKVTADAIAEVAHRLHRSYAEVEGVATFYTMYNTHNVGKHKIEVCTCLTCHLCGAYSLLDYLKEKLGIEPGETTPDGMFTLEAVECLNACDKAPVIQVGDRYHGTMTKDAVDKLLDDLRAQDDSSVVQLARELVKVQLRQGETNQQ